MRGSYRRLFGTLAVSSTGMAFSPRLLSRTGRLSSTLLSSSATSLEHPKLCVGGDFAGLMAKFSPTDGSLVPVPVHLIPSSLLEWGQEPSALEVLVSEEWDSAATVLCRQEVTVLPETGCGVDNLETMKSAVTIDKEQTAWSQPSESTLILDTTTASDAETTIQRLETQFSLPEFHRVRISFDWKIQGDPLSCQIQSPIVLQLERQTNVTSSQGTRADGGGLDGRTVSQLLGDWLRFIRA